MKNITLLSDSELHQYTLTCARTERSALAASIACLAEVARRKLYLQYGCSSLQIYARLKLGYPESSAHRHATAAWLVFEFPELLARLESGEHSLDSLLQVAQAFRERDRIAKARPTPKVQAEMLPKIQPARLTREEKREVLATVAAAPSRKEVQRHLAEVRTAGLTASERPRARLSAHDRQWSELKVYLSAEEEAKLQRLRELLSHAHPSLDLTEIFTRMLDEALNRHDPIRKEERIQARKNPQSKPVQDAAFVHVKDLNTPASKPKRVPIPAALRRQILIRDQGRCQYPTPEPGHKCHSRIYPDLDHIRPVSEGGQNTPQNLRVVCRAHNRNRARIESKQT